jgi:hypothetical protein
MKRYLKVAMLLLAAGARGTGPKIGTLVVIPVRN